MRKGTVWISAGLLLLFGAAGLTGYNLYEDYAAGKASGEILEELSDLPMEVQATGEENLYKEFPDLEMPSKSVGETFYCGVLTFPTQNLQLPVATENREEYLANSPIRYSGSAYKNDLIIGGHNMASHFRATYNLNEGDPVTFTDMDGHEFHYVVLGKEVIPPNGSDVIQEGDWDLTLFTCTFDNTARMLVRCKLVS